MNIGPTFLRHSFCLQTFLRQTICWCWSFILSWKWNWVMLGGVNTWKGDGSVTATRIYALYSLLWKMWLCEVMSNKYCYCSTYGFVDCVNIWMQCCVYYLTSLNFQIFIALLIIIIMWEYWGFKDTMVQNIIWLKDTYLFSKNINGGSNPIFFLKYFKIDFI